MKKKYYLFMVILTCFCGCINVPSIPDYDYGEDGTIQWTLDTKTRILTITGYGTVNFNSQSWNGHRHYVRNVIIKEGISSIGEAAFYHFSGLSSVALPQSLISIEARAFERCYSIGTITIPGNVIYIGDEAFLSCDNLHVVTCLAETPPTIGNHALWFSQINLFVPANSVERYKQAEHWCECQSISPIQ